MASARSLKRRAHRKVSQLCIGVSLSPCGDVSVKLPGRKVLHLTRIELSVIQALPVPRGPQSTSGYALFSGLSSATCGPDTHA